MKNFNYTILDTETTVRCPIGHNKASPHWPDNKIVQAGIITTELNSTYIYKDEQEFKDANSTALLSPTWIIVGVNLPFDLKHCYKAVSNIYKQRKDLKIWDCQIAEYILSRQTTLYPSLDEMSAKRGGTLKPDDLKEFWNNGGQTELYDQNKLRKYLKGDLKNTEIVFKSQIKEAAERKLMPLIIAQMDAVLATTEMEWNGIQVDMDFVKNEVNQLTTDIVVLQDIFTKGVIKNTDIPGKLIDINSPKSLSLVFFGGKVKEKEKQHVGFFKNGNPRMQWVTKEIEYKGLGLDTTGIEKTVHGWSTADDTLTKLKGNPLVDMVDRYRELSKDYGTYFHPVSQLVFPDGKIHQNLNQTATATGRLSCTNPNLQNQTDKGKSKIKQAFVSRWGDKGRLVEFDYKQLEIVALAHLSNDPQLIKDLNDGIDIHTALYEQMYSKKPTEEQRREFKRLSFALIYGSGIKNMAKRGGVSEYTARRFKAHFYHRYAGVAILQLKVSDEIMRNRIANAFHDKETGLPIATSHYTLPTGRELYFREYVQDTPHKGRVTQFSYTQQCNYPVQSFATGDIVPIMLGKLWRYLVNSKYHDKALLINTVHDSVMLDIHEDVLKEVIPIIKGILEAVPETMKHIFNIDIKIKVPVSVTVGTSWYDQKDYPNE